MVYDHLALQIEHNFISTIEDSLVHPKADTASELEEIWSSIDPNPYIMA